MDFAGAGFAGANGGAGGAAAGAGVDLMSWYMEIPVISRIYLTGAFLTTAMCALDIISPFYLYFNWDLVVSHGQLWRLVTSYLFFGLFSIDYLFHMYFLVRSFRAKLTSSPNRCGMERACLPSTLVFCVSHPRVVQLLARRSLILVCRSGTRGCSRRGISGVGPPTTS